MYLDLKMQKEKEKLPQKKMKSKEQEGTTSFKGGKIKWKI